MKKINLKFVRLIAALLLFVPLTTRADVTFSVSNMSSDALSGWSTNISKDTVTVNWGYAEATWDLTGAWNTVGTDFSGDLGYSGFEIKFKAGVVGYVYLNAKYMDVQGTDTTYYTTTATSPLITEADSLATEYTLTCTFDQTWCSNTISIYLTMCNESWAGVYGNSHPIIIESATLLSKPEVPIVDVGNITYINTLWSGTMGTEAEGDTLIAAVANTKSIPYATITYGNDSGGIIGWKYSDSNSGVVNMSAYTDVNISYTVDSVEVDSGEKVIPNANVRVYLEDFSENKDTISGGAPTDTSGEQDIEYTNSYTFDTSKVALDSITKFAIVADTACTVRITAIKLTEVTGTDVVYIHTNDEGRSYVKLTMPQFNSWVADLDTLGGDSIAAKLTYKYYTDDKLTGWLYKDKAAGEGSAVNLNIQTGDYKQLVVNYTIKTEEVRTDNRLQVMLELMDKDYLNVERYDTCCVGRIIYDIPSSGTDSKTGFDPSHIAQIMFSVSGANQEFTLQIDSISLLTEAQVAAEYGLDRYLLMSQLYTWSPEDTKITANNIDEPVAGKDDTSATITSTRAWAGNEWWLDDIDESEHWGVEVSYTTSQPCIVRLAVAYRTDNSDNLYYESISDKQTDSNETTHILTLPFLHTEEGDGNGLTGGNEYENHVNQIQLLWGDTLCVDKVDNGLTFTVNYAKLLAKDAYTDPYIIINTTFDEGYATYYNDTCSYYMPYRMEGSKILGIGNQVENSDTIIYELTTDFTNTSGYVKNTEAFHNTSAAVVPAGTPLLLHGTVDENTTLSYTAFISPESSTPTEAKGNVKRRVDDEENGSGTSARDSYTVSNWLHGFGTTIEENTTMLDKTKSDDGDNAADSYYYYMLSYSSGTVDEDGNIGYPYQNIGFYWGATGGGTFNIDDDKCWLAMPSAVWDELEDEAKDAENEGKVVVFVIGDGSNENADVDVEDEMETTGITTVEAATVVADGNAIYNIAGQRLNSMSKPGLYIVGGKKVIKR